MTIKVQQDSTRTCTMYVNLRVHESVGVTDRYRVQCMTEQVGLLSYYRSRIKLSLYLFISFLHLKIDKEAIFSCYYATACIKCIKDITHAVPADRIKHTPLRSLHLQALEGQRSCRSPAPLICAHLARCSSSSSSSSSSNSNSNSRDE